MTKFFSDCAVVYLEFLVKYLLSGVFLQGIFVKCTMRQADSASLPTLLVTLPTDHITPYYTPLVFGSKLILLNCTIILLRFVVESR